MSAGVSKSTERLINIIVCVGAAVVIFGALQKILHTKLADFFLTAGLLTEALIFVVYAFLPPPGGEMHALVEALPKLAGGTSGNPSLDKMDKMMQEADITPANLNRLSEGFKSSAPPLRRSATYPAHWLQLPSIPTRQKKLPWPSIA